MFCRRSLLLTAIAAILASPLASGASERNYLLATASPGGTFHPVGTALAAAVKIELQQPHGIEMTAVTTAGSTENVRLLHDGEVQLAILQGLIGHEAWTGSGAFAGAGPDPMLRAVTALWPNVEQFVIHAEDSETGTISDLLALKGEPVAFGDTNSGTLASTRILLSNLGAEVDRDFELVHLGYGPAADAFQRGEVAAISVPAGLPTKSLTRLKSAIGDKAVILSFTEEQARQADNGLQLWQRHEIPAGTYPGQAEAVTSIAQPNFMAVRADVSEEDVYLMTRAIYANLPLLRSMHDATEALALESALLGLPVPLHPGAARFFAEHGLEIPDHLTPE